MKKKIVGIYQIQSKCKLDRIYIGSTVNITDRWHLHLQQLKGNKHHSKKLQNHYNKYSKSDLQFSILSTCNKKDLIKFEQIFLDTYKPYFNNRTIANSNLGLKWSAKSRLKMKGNKNALGRKASKETKKKLRESKLSKKNPRYGKVPWNKGKTGVYSKEVLKNMSEGKKGMIAWNKGMNRKEMKEYSKQINNNN